MLIKRRNFIRQSTLAAAGTLLVPKFLQALEGKPGVTTAGKKLVIIQLSGGNDGLNTVIPVRNDIYYQVRPRLAIPGSKAAGITDEAGLHPALQDLAELFKNGEMGILNGVGYPNPDRSHFRSMDIWHTASPANEYWETGWLGRYLDAACAGCSHPTKVLELDDVLSLALKGEQHKGIAFQDPARLYKTSNSPSFRLMAEQHHDGEEPLADYLYKTLAETVQSAGLVYDAAKKHPGGGGYPNTALGKHLQTIAGLMGSDIDTSVYYVSLGSFDTHVNQEMQQARLLRELNDAVKAFVGDLKYQGLFRDTLIMTFSEFGRRVGQNASGGTDHGTANNMFFIGGSLRRQGLLNPLPDLSQLDNGDLRFTTDFRNVYATILQNWLATPPETIMGKAFTTLDFV